MQEKEIKEFAKEVIETQKKILDILKSIAKEEGLSKSIKKDIKEVEDSISVGVPGWISYTRKTRKTKK